MYGQSDITIYDLAERAGVTVPYMWQLMSRGVIPRPLNGRKQPRYTVAHLRAIDEYRKVIPHRGNRDTLACLAQRHHRPAP